jgi:hypothetical protein
VADDSTYSQGIAARAAVLGHELDTARAVSAAIAARVRPVLERDGTSDDQNGKHRES